jgi:hypothetical protein
VEPIRLAKPEEIEKLKEKADIDVGCTVLALDGKNGTDFAVMRTITEVDPIFFDNSTPDSRKALFVWGIENMLRMVNLPFYYFNVAVDEAAWRSVVEKWGAEQTSLAPEIRYKKLL